MIIREYEIALTTYHDEIVGRLCFVRPDGQKESSSLYSLGELSNMITTWQCGQLLGSFAIGCTLAQTATVRMVQF
jgi:hypothetical protein